MCIVLRERQHARHTIVFTQYAVTLRMAADSGSPAGLCERKIPVTLTLSKKRRLLLQL